MRDFIGLMRCRSSARTAILAWLAGQPGYASGESKFAETSMAGDLGYTYGAYALRGGQPVRGFYVRVWTRGTGWGLAGRSRRPATPVVAGCRASARSATPEPV